MIEDKGMRMGKLIPREHAIIAYDLFYNPVLSDLEYQEVYLLNNTPKTSYVILNTGVYIINSSANQQYLKKFNGKWYIKQISKILLSTKEKVFQKTQIKCENFEPPNKKQLQFAFMR